MLRAVDLANKELKLETPNWEAFVEIFLNSCYLLKVIVHIQINLGFEIFMFIGWGLERDRWGFGYIVPMGGSIWGVFLGRLSLESSLGAFLVAV